MKSYLILLAGILLLVAAVPSVNRFVFSMEHPAYGLINIFLYVLFIVLLIGEGRVAQRAAERMEKGEKKIFLVRFLTALIMISVSLSMGFSQLGGFLLALVAASALFLRMMVTAICYWKLKNRK